MVLLLVVYSITALGVHLGEEIRQLKCLLGFWGMMQEEVAWIGKWCCIYKWTEMVFNVHFLNVSYINEIEIYIADSIR